MGVRVVTESDIYVLWSVIAVKGACDNFSVCLLAGLAYLIYKAARHWRRGRKAGSTEPALSYANWALIDFVISQPSS
jgi:hypothetical protein